FAIAPLPWESALPVPSAPGSSPCAALLPAPSSAARRGGQNPQCSARLHRSPQPCSPPAARRSAASRAHTPCRSNLTTCLLLPPSLGPPTSAHSRSMLPPSTISRSQLRCLGLLKRA